MRAHQWWKGVKVILSVNLVAYFDIFTVFDISPLWIDKFRWNWWPNWRFFDALTESVKIFDRYDPQNLWETLEAGAKKWIFSPFWLLWSKNSGTSEIEKDKKSMSKLNYSARCNQWCNRHVDMLKHIDLAELKRSVGMTKYHFLVILVILGSNLGHFTL